MEPTAEVDFSSLVQVTEAPQLRSNTMSTQAGKMIMYVQWNNGKFRGVIVMCVG